MVRLAWRVLGLLQDRGTAPGGRSCRVTSCYERGTEAVRFGLGSQRGTERLHFKFGSEAFIMTGGLDLAPEAAWTTGGPLYYIRACFRN
jgi:hypothetical protein